MIHQLRLANDETASVGLEIGNFFEKSIFLQLQFGTKKVITF